MRSGIEDTDKWHTFQLAIIEKWPTFTFRLAHAAPIKRIEYHSTAPRAIYYFKTVSA